MVAGRSLVLEPGENEVIAREIGTKKGSFHPLSLRTEELARESIQVETARGYRFVDARLLL